MATLLWTSFDVCTAFQTSLCAVTFGFLTQWQIQNFPKGDGGGRGGRWVTNPKGGEANLLFIFSQKSLVDARCRYGRVSPFRPNSFIFVQYLAKNCETIS